jgi:hypothetical protein
VITYEDIKAAADDIALEMAGGPPPCLMPPEAPARWRVANGLSPVGARLFGRHHSDDASAFLMGITIGLRLGRDHPLVPDEIPA